MAKRLSEIETKEYLNALKKYDEDGLYRRAIGQGLMALSNNPNMDLAIMDYSDAFFILFRRTGEQDFFKIGRALRRAAHVLYREILKQNKDRKPNYERFLNIIR